MTRHPVAPDPVRPVAHHIHAPLHQVTFALRPARGHMVVLLGGSSAVTMGGEPASRAIPGLAWLPAGNGGRLVFAPGSVGWLLELPGPRLARAVPPGLDEAMRGLLGKALFLPLDNPALRDELQTGMRAMRDELATAGPGFDAACDCRLGLMLLSLWRLALAHRAVGGGETSGLSDRFVLLAQQNARSHWSVAEYCGALGVDRDRLGRVVHRATGLSPRAYLHGELHRQACDLLLGTGLQVRQVAYRLGFSDPAYFNRFFTRMEGTPPSRFRRNAARARSATDGSFAAWP
ncbi:helix-turn-helix domain-containing protein [Palleronia sediminis]|uniref:Helix-turn-helix domain-containing protein n=1 Tax=Palleronia sediminis TaxID=2547833 RepID=A0A4R6AB94_9RHOB|nr:helix-turn-helix domain-containing protein [Palleronia sediminis]TDL81090.1 helix-turn-helix domain-containing protein [Palleronia sediminis]